jgi:hypothetical protein
MESRTPREQSAHEPEGLPASEVLPTTSNARSRVHEYGGGAVMVANGYAYWSEFDDNRVYSRKMDAGYWESPVAITRGRRLSRPLGGRCATDYSLVPHTSGGISDYRYADFDFHATDPNLLICVREDLTSGTGHDVKTSIICIDTSYKTVRVLLPARKEGFYAFPRFGGVDGCKVAWIEVRRIWSCISGFALTEK